MKNNKLQWGLLSTARINHALFKPLCKSKRNELPGMASMRCYQQQESAPPPCWKGAFR
jgi:hypothetical protein